MIESHSPIAATDTTQPTIDGECSLKSSFGPDRPRFILRRVLHSRESGRFQAVAPKQPVEPLDTVVVGGLPFPRKVGCDSLRMVSERGASADAPGAPTNEFIRPCCTQPPSLATGTAVSRRSNTTNRSGWTGARRPTSGPSGLRSRQATSQLADSWDGILPWTRALAHW